MGPKKKKQPYNDFYFFMQDQKKELARQGRHYDTMEDLAALCHGRWKNLSDRDKALYKNKAKQWKEKEKHNLENKFDAQGRSLADLQREKEAQQKAQDDMLARIDKIIRQARGRDRLPETNFYLVHFNILAKTDDTPARFLPCEIGLVEFSLRDGVKRSLHDFMYPSDVPVGYSYAIRDNAEKTHKLDLDQIVHKKPKSSDDLANQYSWLLRRIKDFVNPNEVKPEYPPLFTLEEEVETAVSILEDMAGWSGERGRTKLQVFVLHELFFKLCRGTPDGDMLPDSIIAKDQLEKEIYLYTPNIACQFHDNIDQPR